MFYLWTGSEDGVEYTAKNEQDVAKLRWNIPSIGEPLVPLEKWKPIIMVQSASGKRKKLKDPGDAPTSALINFVSAKAVDALSDIFDRHALLYPLIREEKPDDPLYMVVAKTVLDCIDREKSVGSLQKYGPTPELFATIHEWVLDEECIGDNDLFVLPDSKTRIYVSERFKQRVIEADLKKVCFKTQFPQSDPWIS